MEGIIGTSLLAASLSDGAQYLCTAVLVIICVLIVANISVTIRQKYRRRNEMADTSAAVEHYGAADQTASLQGSREPVADPSAGIFAAQAAAMAAGEELAAASAEQGAAGRLLADSLLPFPLAGTSRIVYGNYDRSFLARLLLAAGTVKAYYAELANDLLGYKNVRCRISWACASFVCGRRILAKIAIKGKTLCLHLPLDPAAYVHTKYGAIDVSEVKKYAAVPTRLKVRSPRGVKYARQLISLAAKELSLVRGETGCLTAADFPYEPFASLFARGLIKLRTKGGVPLEDGDTLAWAGIERRERVSAAEVRQIALPEQTMRLETVPSTGHTRRARSGKKCIVNIDTLSAHFSAGDTVDIAAMKEKGLISRKEKAVKVLARGVIGKPLTVIADDFSADAVKMIVLTGGKVFLS